MAGATKDMFDRCYNDWLDTTAALPVGIYIRAGLDGTATRRALNGICAGLKWRLVADPLVLCGAWDGGFVTRWQGALLWPPVWTVGFLRALAVRQFHQSMS